MQKRLFSFLAFLLLLFSCRQDACAQEKGRKIKSIWGGMSDYYFFDESGNLVFSAQSYSDTIPEHCQDLYRFNTDGQILEGNIIKRDNYFYYYNSSHQASQIVYKKINDSGVWDTVYHQDFYYENSRLKSSVFINGGYKKNATAPDTMMYLEYSYVSANRMIEYLIMQDPKTDLPKKMKKTQCIWEISYDTGNRPKRVIARDSTETLLAVYKMDHYQDNNKARIRSYNDKGKLNNTTYDFPNIPFTFETTDPNASMLISNLQLVDDKKRKYEYY